MCASPILWSSVASRLSGSPSHNSPRLVVLFLSALLNLCNCSVDITQILKVVGVAEGSDEIGFPVGGGGSEAQVAGVLDRLTAFRDTVRAISRSRKDVKDIIAACDALKADVKDGKDGPKVVRLEEQVAGALSEFCTAIRKACADGYPALLAACDSIRDDVMTEIGVRLEDATSEGAASTWKLDDPETLKKEVAAKRQEAAARAGQAKDKEIAKKKKELEKLLRGAADPLATMAADIEGVGLSVDDLTAWEGQQGPPKPKGKPTPEFIAAMKAATDSQNAFLEKLTNGVPSFDRSGVSSPIVLH